MSAAHFKGMLIYICSIKNSKHIFEKQKRKAPKKIRVSSSSIAHIVFPKES